jgi:Dolichyl-phosphate-mannose-protein mannosyltransferase
MRTTDEPGIARWPGSGPPREACQHAGLDRLHAGSRPVGAVLEPALEPLPDWDPAQDWIRELGRAPEATEGLVLDWALEPGWEQAQDWPLEPPRHAPRRRVTRWGWLLFAVVAVQAALSLRLVWSNTAFQDEALYLWAGHLEWSHWLYGAPAPAFQDYFSGAPVLYPPLGALADTYGGLASARLLSLFFMLAATSLLYGTARRLFDRRAAFFAAALFAGLGATQFLGAFATFDAMAIALLALASWLGVRAADKGRRPRLLSLILAGAVLALANATKYASGLLDPVVIAVAMACMWRRRGTGAAAAGGTVMLMTCAALIGIGLMAGGSGYWLGLTSTTLTRANDNVPAYGIVYASAEWVGGIALLAVIGAIAAFAKRLGRPVRALACVLVTAVFLAPAEQARIHTITSLFKHVGFGAWFGCIMAGFALACLATAVPAVKTAGAVRVGIAATVLGAVAGAAMAGNHYSSWPGSASFTVRLEALAKKYPGPVLEDNDIPQYYIPDLRWRSRAGTVQFTYVDPRTGRKLSGPGAYLGAIRHGYFSIIDLSFANTIQDDNKITHDISVTTAYRLAAVIPYEVNGVRAAYKIWVRAPAGSQSRHAGTHRRAG